MANKEYCQRLIHREGNARCFVEIRLVSGVVSRQGCPVRLRAAPAGNRTVGGLLTPLGLGDIAGVCVIHLTRREVCLQFVVGVLRARNSFFEHWTRWDHSDR